MSWLPYGVINDNNDNNNHYPTRHWILSQP